MIEYRRSGEIIRLQTVDSRNTHTDHTSFSVNFITTDGETHSMSNDGFKYLQCTVHKNEDCPIYEIEVLKTKEGWQVVFLHTVRPVIQEIP